MIIVNDMSFRRHDVGELYSVNADKSIVQYNAFSIDLWVMLSIFMSKCIEFRTFSLKRESSTFIAVSEDNRCSFRQMRAIDFLILFSSRQVSSKKLSERFTSDTPHLHLV